jgi:hypothetical protein
MDSHTETIDGDQRMFGVIVKLRMPGHRLLPTNSRHRCLRLYPTAALGWHTENLFGYASVTVLRDLTLRMEQGVRHVELKLD